MRKRVKGLLLLALILCVSCSFISYAAEQKDTVESVADETLDSEIEVQEEEKSEESTSESAPIHTGWYEDELGNRYLYNQDGSLYFGWKYENDKWYYLDGMNTEHPGIMVKDGVFPVGNQYYCFNQDGVMYGAGWIQREEGWYYANPNGSLVTGWIKLKNIWYYLDGNDTEHPYLMAEDCTKVVGNKRYFFNAGGAMRTGWMLYPEGWYYAESNGAQAIGWKKLKNIWYYLDDNDTEHPGLMADDCIKDIAGKIYFFRVGGAMRTGWISYPEGWYYAEANGAQAIGWRRINGAWYYLDGNNTKYPGLMVSDCSMEIGEHTYIFEANGAMREGWYQDGQDWYYYDTSGLIASGWRAIKGYWYYLDPNNDNKLVSGRWKTIGNNWYHFRPSGAMSTHWLAIGGNWYYLAGDGAMRTGWQSVNGAWYYMYKKNDPYGGKEGVMARSRFIGGYCLGNNGAMLSDAMTRLALRAQGYSSRTGYLILVDRASCKVAIFTGRTGAWIPICEWACSPGKPSTPTFRGEFTVGLKGYYFDSGNARCYWYTQFCGDYLFHSVLYNKYSGRLADGRLGMQLSHGCVRLAIQNAKWIYDNIPTGTKVVVF